MSTKDSHESGCNQIGALTDAHKKFRPFAGTFIAKITMWFAPDEPMVSTGVMVNTLDLDGRFLFQSYTGDAKDGQCPNFQGRGFWGYNTISNKYEGFWIDSASTYMQTEQGELDASGKVWTMIGEMIDPQSGKPLHKRSVITLSDNHHHEMEMYLQEPKGQEYKAVAVNYIRKSE